MWAVQPVTRHNHDHRLFAAGPILDVEDGRLNLALRDVLATLGVMSAEESAEVDCVIEVVRLASGEMSARSTWPGPAVVPSGAVVSLAMTIVAGANIVGRVDVLFATRSGEPVFVAVRQGRDQPGSGSSEGSVA